MHTRTRLALVSGLALFFVSGCERKLPPETGPQTPQPQGYESAPLRPGIQAPFRRHGPIYPTSGSEDRGSRRYAC